MKKTSTKKVTKKASKKKAPSKGRGPLGGWEGPKTDRNDSNTEAIAQKKLTQEIFAQFKENLLEVQREFWMIKKIEKLPRFGSKYVIAGKINQIIDRVNLLLDETLKK